MTDSKDRLFWIWSPKAWNAYRFGIPGGYDAPWSTSSEFMARQEHYCEMIITIRDRTTCGKYVRIEPLKEWKKVA